MIVTVSITCGSDPALEEWLGEFEENEYNQSPISQILVAQRKSYYKEYSLDTIHTYSLDTIHNPYIQFGHNPYFYLHFSICYFKLLIPQSKFSGTRKFTLRYQQFGKTVDFELLRVDCTCI